MEGVRLTVALIIAVVLQWTLRSIFEPLAYIDFPLIIIVFAALQRNSIRAIIFATVSGVAIDALSGGLLGASGFSKTLVAYMVFEQARGEGMIRSTYFNTPCAPDLGRKRKEHPG